MLSLLTILFLGAAPAFIGTRVTPAQVVDDEAEEAALHTLAASHYFAGSGWVSTLTLNNKGPHPKEVVPTLYALDGVSYHPDPVDVPGDSFVDLNLQDWVQQAGPAFRSGKCEHQRDWVAEGAVSSEPQAQLWLHDAHLGTHLEIRATVGDGEALAIVSGSPRRYEAWSACSET